MLDHAIARNQGQSLEQCQALHLEDRQTERGCE